MAFGGNDHDEDDSFEARVLHSLHQITDILHPFMEGQARYLNLLQTLVEGQHAMTDQFATAQSDLDAKIAEVNDKVGIVATDVSNLLAKVGGNAALQASADAEVAAVTASTASLQASADQLAAIDTSVNPAPPAPPVEPVAPAAEPGFSGATHQG